MTSDQQTSSESGEKSGQLSRRGLFAGTGGAAALAAGGSALLPGGTAFAHDGTPLFWHQPGRTGAPEVHGVHLTFGADPSREMVVS
ncbi:hypothetical protein [Dactylosporangium sp. CA-139066]|uniref:hypothetical protein n=1 Tax=Dactylosporangium sp. CA-139066 TaxID=3239930 RepID=UPI003D8C5801